VRDGEVTGGAPKLIRENLRVGSNKTEEKFSQVGVGVGVWVWVWAISVHDEKR
jgi:hypothetical protein